MVALDWSPNFADSSSHSAVRGILGDVGERDMGTTGTWASKVFLRDLSDRDLFGFADLEFR